MNRNEVDDVILGGGCAGLSLAVQITTHLPDRRIAIIEPRTEYVDDRTWCYWSLDTHPFEDAVGFRWRRWASRHAGAVHLQVSNSLSYCEIRSKAFYDSALRQLEKTDQVQLRLGARAQGIIEHPDGITVETDAGVIEAQRAYDSRVPKASGSMAPELLQHFVGLRVKGAQPCFDPSTVTLMDFDVPQELGIHFVYVLPYDEKTALVEATFLSPSPFPSTIYISAIEEYLARRYRMYEYEVIDSEHGAIPMSTRSLQARVSSRVYRIGTAGGLVKPSTGYAFLAIQRFSKQLAHRLTLEELPEPPVVRGSSSRFLDTVFLRVLDRHPHRAPELFSRLFDRVEPDALVRFLNDRSTVGDRLQVMAAVPPWPFIKEALQGGRAPREVHRQSA